MIALFFKEIRTFFSSVTGYLVIGVFLVTNGLFLWVFKGEYNIFNNGIASLNSFFFLAPWVLLFLVPSLTMKSFSEELKQGTLELLVTKPLTPLQIVLGKYLGALTLILIALLPTLIYVYTILNIQDELSGLDIGSTLGSYLGLLFLIAVYTAIGVFTSALTDNQIISFIAALFISFLLFYGLEGLSNYTIFGDIVFLENLGLSSHYNSISRGVIDTRDIIYFLSLTALFIYFTKIRIQNK